MSTKITDEHAQDDRLEASRQLDARIRQGNIAKWERIWADAGIKFAGESMESWLGDVRRQHGAAGAVPVGETPLAVGDLVALREDESPSDSNQHLHRVIELRQAESGSGMVAVFGTALPRSEWPEAMRAATAPTTIYVERALGTDGDFVHVMNGSGTEILRLPVGGDGGIREGYIQAAVAEAARSGYADGMEGRRRGYNAVKGHDVRGDGTRTWQVVDSLGGARDIERRGLLQRRPPAFTEAVLVATKAAYVDGMTEALDVKAGAERDAEADAASAPRM